MNLSKQLLFKRRYWEYFAPTLCTASLIVACIVISSKKYYWNDELYSYYLLADSSFTQMLSAFHDKINNTPPFYFLVGWLWARVLGVSELSLRLFSSLGIVGASTIAWIVLRRTYNFWSATFGTLSIFCTVPLILQQNAEARMYGLFLGLAALALLQFDQLCRTEQPPRWLIFTNACTHAAFTLTHLFGLFYSGAIVAALLINDRDSKRFRSRLYLSIAASWLILILYIPSFLIQADAGNPRTWLPIPTRGDLVWFLTSIFPSARFFILLALIAGFQLLVSRVKLPQFSRSTEPQSEADSERSLLIFAFAFLAVPIATWLISRTIKPIFYDRYLIPSVISSAILFAHIASRLIVPPDYSDRERRPSQLTRLLVWGQRIVLLGFVVLLLAQPLLDAKQYQRQHRPGLNDNAFGYQELPIVTQFSHRFLERHYYSPEANRYFFILDWDAAIDPHSGMFTPQEFKHLTAIKRNYPERFENYILSSEQFLSRYSRFLVLDYEEFDRQCPLRASLEEGRKWENFHCPQWVEKHLLNNPDYKVRVLGQIDGQTMLLVDRQNAAEG